MSLKATTNMYKSDDVIHLTFVGDIMLSRKVGEKIISAGPKFVLEPIQNILGKSDLLCGNLESPISESVIKSSGFNAPVLAVEVIKYFNIVTLANNHIFDCGDEGIENTIEILTKNGISYVGISKTDDFEPVIFTIKGKKIAFLGCASDELFERTQNSKFFMLSVNDKRMPKIIEISKKKSDFFALLFHGGEEFIPYPSPSVRKRLKYLTDSGVDFIAGHHPHVLSGYESAKANTLIWYSLGDFVFDSMVKERRRGGIFTIRIDEASATSFEFIPTFIDDSLRVVPAPDKLAKDILQDIEYRSRKLQTATYERRYTTIAFNCLIKYAISRLHAIYKYEGISGIAGFLWSRIKHIRSYLNKFIKRKPHKRAV